MMANQSSTVKVIEKVIAQARTRYNDLMQSEYISFNLKIDGISTKGQCQDNKRQTNIKEENTKQMTCTLDVPVKRGSLVEMISDPKLLTYDLKGIVISTPTETPVDYFFSTLLFNTVVTRKRNQFLYNDDGDVIDNSPFVDEKIDAFVQRVGMRERQIDAGIDRNSVNQIITTNEWDIKKDDILYIADDKYKITDLEELENDMISGFMTYYRE